MMINARQGGAAQARVICRFRCCHLSGHYVPQFPCRTVDRAVPKFLTRLRPLIMRLALQRAARRSRELAAKFSLAGKVTR